MRLVVKQNDRLVNQLQFIKGPIHIGRHAQCQVFLPSPSVSRQHAVIFLSEEGHWLVKDLHSTNKTLLNCKVVGQAQIDTGDRIQVGEYIVEVDLEDNGALSKLVHLEDTQAPASHDRPPIIRKLDGEHAPPIRMPAYRAADLNHLLRKAVGTSGGETLEAVLKLLISQFRAGRVWGSFKYDTDGLLGDEGGLTSDGQTFDLKSDVLKRHIKQACANQHLFLFSRVDQQASKGQAASAIIAPIIAYKGNLGVLYIESRPDRGPFSMSDLDYALLLSIGLGVILEYF